MADDLVMVSVKMPRSLYARLQAYAKEHRYSVSELLRDGVEWRLGEEADPLAYRFGGTWNTSTGDVEPSADQEQSAVERHQELMTMLRAIREHQRRQQPVEPLPAPVGAVIPVIPTVQAVAEAPVGVVISVIPTVSVASVETCASVIPVIPLEVPAGAPVEPVIPVIPPETEYDPSAFDTTRYYLGKLCPHGHDFEGTGHSLLRKHNQRCRECENASRREKRQAKHQAAPAD